MSAIRGATRLRRGAKARKARKSKGNGLSQDDIDYLTKNTKYDETEIREWYKGFKVMHLFGHWNIALKRMFIDFSEAPQSWSVFDVFEDEVFLMIFFEVS